MRTFATRPLIILCLGACFALGACTGGDESAEQTDDSVGAEQTEQAGNTNEDTDGGDAAATASADRPNVLLLIADDLGVESSICYSESAPASPRLEAFCQDAVVFDQAWSSPICSPTRAAMLTGRYGFRTGIGEQQTSDNNIQIGSDEWTLPRVLDAADAGYAHASFGKWHLGGDNAMPNEMGWSHFSGLLTGGLRDYYRWDKVTNGETETVDAYATTETVDDTIGWIDDQDQPWFAWVAFNAPHTPFHVPPADLHSGDLSSDQADIEADPAPYYAAAIEAMDTEIGRLIDSIDPEELANTTVIFIGDNGSPGQISAHERGRSKGSLHQGGVHVPMMIWGAGVEASGRTDALAGTVDLFATIAELTGVDVDAVVPGEVALDAESLMPILTDPSGGASVQDVLFTELFGTASRPNRVGQTVRNDRYQLIEFTNGRSEFFDLQVDPMGADPVANPSPEEQANLDELQAALDEIGES